MTSDVALIQAKHAVREPRVITLGLTVVAILSGAWLRWSGLGRLSLWWDEGYTAWASNLSSVNIIRYAQGSDAPPLYFLLQHYWTALFGTSESALRGFSAFCGTVSLPIFYLLAKKLLKADWAVALATWMFAFSIMQLWYSQEARFYELASLFSLAGLYALVLFLERRSVTLFSVIVLSATASLYTHNMMLFYVLALNVAWLIFPSERTWTQRAKEVLVADVLVGVLFLPWVPTLLSQTATVHQGFWVQRPTISTLIHTLVTFAGFYPDYLLALGVRILPSFPHAIWVSILTGAALLSLAMVGGGLWRVAEEDRRKNVALMVYGLLPILMVFLLSQITRPLFIDRVFISSSVVIPIVFAYPLAVQKGRKARTVYGVLGIVLGVAIALSGFGYLRYQEKEDWRRVTQILLKIPEKNRLIVFMTSRGEFLFDYYAQRSSGPSVATIGLPASYREKFPPPKARIVDASEINKLRLLVESKNYSEIDLILSHDLGADPNGLVLNYLNHFGAPQEEQRFNGIKVIRFSALLH